MGFARNIAQERGVLAPLLQRLGLPVSLASPLLAHANAVRDAGERLGLVSDHDLSSIVRRHTADSLLFALARPPELGERWADVGSGAGFPGLVLACCYPNAHFTLIEPHSRRAGFLDLQVAGLGLSNATVLARRLQEVEGGFDVAVARALHSPRETLLTLNSLVRQGGLSLVAAGPNEDVPQGATIVRLEDVGDVDSPGVLLMMSHG